MSTDCKPEEGETVMFDTITMETARDGVQILMCGVILAALIWNRMKPALPRAEAPIAGFSDEVRLQALRQQAEQSLAAIQQTVNAERRRLEHLLPVGDPVGGSAEPEASDLAPFRLGETQLREDGAGSRYDALPRLAAGGLTPRELAVQTRLPAGEIELALKLRRAMAAQAQLHG